MDGLKFKIGDEVVRIRSNTKKYVWTISGRSSVFKDNVVVSCINEELCYHFHQDELRLATDGEKLKGERNDDHCT